MKVRRLLPFFYLGALCLGAFFLLESCNSTESGKSRTLLTVEADSAYFQFDTLWVGVINMPGSDTVVVFKDSLESFDQLAKIELTEELSLEIKIIIRGFMVGHRLPDYEEVRQINIESGKLIASNTPIDQPGNANLEYLDVVDGSVLPAFDNELQSFSSLVSYAFNFIEVRVHPENILAKVSIGGFELMPGDSTVKIPLIVGANIFPVLVTSPNGKIQKKFELFITRKKNDDASLKALSVSNGTISPPFDSNVYDYQILLDNTIDNLRFTLTASDGENSHIRHKDTKFESGVTGPSVSIQVGTDTLLFDVLAHDEIATKTYRVLVTRLPSKDASLKNLTTSTGVLKPIFDPRNLRYADTVPNAISGISFNPVLNSDQSKIFLDGKQISVGVFSDTLDLQVGNNVFHFLVIAQNGDSGKYFVEIRRRSANVRLSELSIFPGSLEPDFSPNLFSYFDTVPAGLDSLLIRAKAEDSSIKNIRIGESLKAANTLSSLVYLKPGQNFIPITVVSEDGELKTYQLAIYRQSDEARLSSLDVDALLLRPGFDPNVFSYVDSLATGIESIAISAKCKFPRVRSLSIQNTIFLADTGSLVVPVQLGTNHISIRITAEDWSVREYSLVVYRKHGFSRLLGGKSSYEEAFSVQQTFDNGFIVSGSAHVSGFIESYLAKTDASGILQWSKTLSQNGGSQGYSVMQTQDTGFIVVGRSGVSTLSNVFMLKVSRFGDQLWNRTFGGVDDEIGLSVSAAGDDGFLVAGGKASSNPDSSGMYLIKTNANGDSIWTRTITRGEYLSARSIQKSNNGGSIVVGSGRFENADNYDIWMIKLNAIGDTQWTKTFGGPGNDIAYSVIATKDGGYAIAGTTSSFGAGGEDIYVIKTDSTGASQWTKTYGGSKVEDGRSIVQTSDGGFAIGATTGSAGSGSSDFYLIKTDALGNPKWWKTYGGTDYDAVRSMQMTREGGFILGGISRSSLDGDYDILIVKTDAEGNSE